ncbi:hypothetical protein HDU98_006234 [Podochytrium sp. JEL0797]|nr:hypothetical protein HDU98_006234 [Podochytrium sp. JEL0797]
MGILGLKPDPRHALLAFFLKIFAVTVGFVPMQQMLLLIVCKDHLQSDESPDYATCAANAQVQAIAASWSLRISMAEQIPSLSVIVVAGHFLDKFGRTPAMLLSGLSVLTVSCVSLFVAASFENDLSLVSASTLLSSLVLAAFVSGCGGGMVLFRTACSAYLGDTTTIQTRTHYFMLLDAAMSVAITGGPLLGGFLATSVSFTAAFSATLAIAIFLLLHLIVVFPSSTVVAPSPTTASPKSLSTAFVDSLKSTFSSLHTVFQFRTAVALLSILTVLSFLLAGAQLFFLFYPSKVFGWTSLDFGKFALFAASQKIVWLSLALPWFLRMVKRKGGDKIEWEIILLRVGLCVGLVGEIGYALAPSPILFALCSLLASCTCFAAPTIRSLLSTMVPASHLGRLFGAIQMFESFSGIGATVMLNLVYQATVDTHPASVFWVMVGLLVVAVGVSFGMVSREGAVDMEHSGGSTAQEAGEESDDEDVPLLHEEQ